MDLKVKSIERAENLFYELRVTSLKNNQIDDAQLKFFYPSDYSKNLEKHILHPNEIVISKDGTIGKVSFNNKDRSFYLSSQLIKVIPRQGIHTKYLFHFLISKTKEIEQMTTGKSAILHLNLTKFKDLKIPVPTVEKQKEIANKLDKFWKLSEELCEELCEELNLRKQQYEYYRDELLSFKQDNKIEWLTLEKIATNLYRGIGIKKDEAIEGLGYSCVRYGWIHTSNLIYFDKCKFGVDENLLKTKKYAEKGDILFAIISENIKDIEKACAYIGEEKILIGDGVVVMKHNQNSKYLAYALSTTNAQKQKEYGKIKLRVVNSSVPNIKKLMIPVPSLEKQEEIVNLLDKFWKLSNDIKNGLPKEIFLRKQQYEYYRDKLLKFEILKV